jgi:hypothetical protein
MCGRVVCKCSVYQPIDVQASNYAASLSAAAGGSSAAHQRPTTAPGSDSGRGSQTFAVRKLQDPVYSSTTSTASSVNVEKSGPRVSPVLNRSSGPHRDSSPSSPLFALAGMRPSYAELRKAGKQEENRDVNADAGAGRKEYSPVRKGSSHHSGQQPAVQATATAPTPATSAHRSSAEAPAQVSKSNTSSASVPSSASKAMIGRHEVPEALTNTLDHIVSQVRSLHLSVEISFF